MSSRTSLLFATFAFACVVPLAALPAGGRPPAPPQGTDRCTQVWEDVNASHRRLQDFQDRRDRVTGDLAQDNNSLANARGWRLGLQAYVAMVETGLRQFPVPEGETPQDRLWRQQYRDAIGPMRSLGAEVGRRATELQSQIGTERSSSDALDEALNTERRLFDRYVSERDQCQAGMLSFDANSPSSPFAQDARRATASR